MCGAKGSGRLGPFRIISPRAQPMRAKEGPQLLGGIVEERHVLGNWCPERKGQYATHRSFPCHPQTKGLA